MVIVIKIVTEKLFECNRKQFKLEKPKKKKIA